MLAEGSEAQTEHIDLVSGFYRSIIYQCELRIIHSFTYCQTELNICIYVAALGH